jgi:hypothetical protein
VDNPEFCRAVMPRAAVICLCLATFLLACSSPATSQVFDDNLIVPGTRIGKWTLTTTVGDLLQTFGPTPGLTLPPGPLYQAGFTLLAWPSSPSLSVLTRDRRKIELLFIGSRGGDYTTEKGVSVGKAGTFVLEGYGSPGTRVPANRNILVYDDIGIAFNVSDDRVSTIFVFRAREAASIWRL